MKNTTNFLTYLALIIFFSLFELVLFNLEFRYIYWDLRHFKNISIYILSASLNIVYQIRCSMILQFLPSQSNELLLDKKKKKNSISFKKIGILLFFVLPMGKFSFWLEKVKLTLTREPMDRIWNLSPLKIQKHHAGVA